MASDLISWISVPSINLDLPFPDVCLENKSIETGTRVSAALSFYPENLILSPSKIGLDLSFPISKKPLVHPCSETMCGRDVGENHHRSLFTA